MTVFGLPTTVTVSGTEYPVRTDFRVILEIFVMLEDPNLSDSDKTEALLRMFYEDRPPAEDTDAALRAFLDFLEPGNLSLRTIPQDGVAIRSPSRSSRPSLIRWEQDFHLIVGPVNHVLGMECRSTPYLHWYTFLAAYMDIDPESVFSQVLRIREKLRSGKKLEKVEREFYRRNPDLVDPPKALTAAEKDLLKDWA